MAGKSGLTPLGRVVVIVFVLALVGGALYLFRDTIFPKAAGQGNVDLNAFAAESQDPTGITTVNEYTYVPAQKLPPVQGADQMVR